MPFKEFRRKTAEERASINEAEDKERRAEERRENERKAMYRDEEVRRRRIEDVTKLCFDESKIDLLTDELIRIRDGIESISKNHSSRASIYNNNDKDTGEDIYQSISLRWHKSDSWASGGIDYSIHIGFFPDGTMVVQGSSIKRISRSIWQRDSREIEKALEYAFKNPKQFYPNDWSSMDRNP